MKFSPVKIKTAKGYKVSLDPTDYGIKVIGRDRPYVGLEDNMTQSAHTLLSHYKLEHAHIANERKTSLKVSKTGSVYTSQGAKFKRMGVRKGMPDFLVFESYYNEQNGIYNGIAIELKAKTGRCKIEQIETLCMLRRKGWHCLVAYSLGSIEEFIKIEVLPNLIKKNTTV
jgi:hypothetical protein